MRVARGVVLYDYSCETLLDFVPIARTPNKTSEMCRSARRAFGSGCEGERDFDGAHELDHLHGARSKPSSSPALQVSTNPPALLSSLDSALNATEHASRSFAPPVTLRRCDFISRSSSSAQHSSNMYTHYGRLQ